MNKVDKVKVEKVKEIAFKAHVLEREFVADSGDTLKYLSIEMQDPFDDFLEPIVLSFEKLNMKDGQKQLDRKGKQNKGIYMHNVRKALRNTADLVLMGAITRRVFKNDKKELIEYICLELQNLDDEFKTRVYINNIEAKAIVDKLATDRLEVIEDISLA